MEKSPQYQFGDLTTISSPGNAARYHRGGSKRRGAARKRTDQSKAGDFLHSGGSTQSVTPDFKIEGRRIHLPSFATSASRQQRAYFGYHQQPATTLPLVTNPTRHQVSNSNRYTFSQSAATNKKPGNSPQVIRKISSDSAEGKNPGDCCNAFGLILGGLCGGGSAPHHQQGENPNKIPVKNSLLRFIGAKSRDSRQQQVCSFYLKFLISSV